MCLSWKGKSCNAGRLFMKCWQAGAFAGLLRLCDSRQFCAANRYPRCPWQPSYTLDSHGSPKCVSVILLFSQRLTASFVFFKLFESFSLQFVQMTCCGRVWALTKAKVLEVAWWQCAIHLQPKISKNALGMFGALFRNCFKLSGTFA